LRKTKLDELPQLFNILLGDMSLVGPRPELPAYVASYTAEQRATLGVKPGATGPSINVYEEELLASRPDREQLYVTVVLPAKLTIAAAYCEDIRFFEDIRIIGWSIRIVLGRLLELFRMPSASRERALHGSQSLRDS
jgi:lipopolysaccharide/colanic/teichoic acid biosynthesis glycosyltransferase